MSELYGPSPDLALIERLDRRLKELRRQSRQSAETIAEQVYREFSSQDRLKIMKMNYPLPPQIIILDKPNADGTEISPAPRPAANLEER